MSYTTTERMRMSTTEWLEKVVGVTFRTVRLAGGPFHGTTKDEVSTESGALRLEHAGYGVATYKATGREDFHGDEIFAFTGYEEESAPSPGVVTVMAHSLTDLSDACRAIGMTPIKQLLEGGPDVAWRFGAHLSDDVKRDFEYIASRVNNGKGWEWSIRAMPKRPA